MVQNPTFAHNGQTQLEFLNNAGLTAIVWVVLFEANAYFAENLALNQYVSWIFLPAAVRLISVLLAGYAGVLGLFVGALLTNMPIDSVTLIHATALSTISAITPLLALWLVKTGLRISNNLMCLRWWHLVIFAAVGAVCNVVATQLYFGLSQSMSGMGNSWWPMLIGDLVGASVVLYAASFCLRIYEAICKRESL